MNQNVVDLGAVVACRAHDAVVALRLARERVEALDLHVADLRREVEAGKAVARRTAALTDYGELSRAMRGRVHRARLVAVRASLDRWQTGLALHDLRVTAGAALDRMDRAEARRVYSESFPGLSPQRTGAAVAALVRDHRASRRASVRRAVLGAA